METMTVTVHGPSAKEAKRKAEGLAGMMHTFTATKVIPSNTTPEIYEVELKVSNKPPKS